MRTSETRRPGQRPFPLTSTTNCGSGLVSLAVVAAGLLDLPNLCRDPADDTSLPFMVGSKLCTAAGYASSSRLLLRTTTETKC